MLYRKNILENHKFEERQNDNNSCTFWNSRSIMKILLIVQNSRHSNEDDFFTHEKIPNKTSMEEFQPIVGEEWNLSFEFCENFYQFLAFLDFQVCDARIKIHHSSFKQFDSCKYAGLQPLMEESKHVGQ